MKPHLKLKLREAIGWVPHWRDVIERGAQPPQRLHPALDALFDAHGVEVWVTGEYAPRGRRWSAAEVEQGFDRIYRLILQRSGRIPDALVREISLHPLVEYADVGRVRSVPMPEPRAQALSRNTDMRSRQAIFVPEAHRDFGEGHADITVAVLDTGVSLGHPELRAHIVDGADFVNIIDGAPEFIGDYLDADPDPEDRWVGHGTHVAGIACGAGRNMPPGVARGCALMPVRVLGAMRRGSDVFGAGLQDNINVATKWAVDHGADVINMSLGVLHEGGGLPHEEVVRYAQAQGATLVAASGNDGLQAEYYPATLPHVITTGAFDQLGQVAAFSTWGRHVDLLAPGTNIYSSFLGDGYAFSTGTSHAAPFVVGAVALLKSFALREGYQLSDKQAKYALRHSAERIDHRPQHPRAGFGRLNVWDALKLVDHKLHRTRGIGRIVA